MTDLASKTVLVTGSGRGLGRAVALCLAQLGARTAVLARTRSEVDETLTLIHAAGGECCGFTADVGQPEQVRTVFDQLGPLDILINNAAVTPAGGPFGGGRPGRLAPGLRDQPRRHIPGHPAGTARHARPGLGPHRQRDERSRLTTGPAASQCTHCQQGRRQPADRESGRGTDRRPGRRVSVCAVDPGTVDTAMQHYTHGLPAETRGPGIAAEFRHVHASGRLHDPHDLAQLVAGAVLGGVSGEIVVMGTARARALMAEPSIQPAH